tara:strand:+ start:298 stop:495 length:198 start_codon:yes stop_codon:yes gene_type:complete
MTNKKNSLFAELLEKTDLDDQVLDLITDLDERRNNLLFVIQKFPVATGVLVTTGAVAGLCISLLF